MKTYPRLFRKLFCEPLLLHAPTRAAFETELLRRMYGDSAVSAIPMASRAEMPMMPDDSDDDEPEEYRVKNIYQRRGSVAVITIDGVIDKRLSDFDMECYGGVDLSDVDEALAYAATDARVSTVVLDIHSPGGSVVGVHETYTRIMQLAETKEIHAYVNAMACSAGYYLASAADYIAAAPSAIVGSIGVYMALLDASRWYENEGLKINVMQAGKWKTMGAEWKKLEDDEREKLQAGVIALHVQFKAAVNAKRPQVAADSMEGQWMTGEEGMELGLVDELTGATLDEYVSALLTAQLLP
jgi:signal peptide peptidase SppA